MSRPTPDIAVGWLVRSRAGLVAAQALAVLVARGTAETPFELGPPLALVAVGLLSNLGLALARPRGALGRGIVGPVLLADTVVLTLLLLWTGGPMNPFTVLYLVHVTQAAMLLEARWVAPITALSLAGFGLLFLVGGGADPHAHHDHAGGGAMDAHLRGMWIAFAAAATLVAVFVARLRLQLARQDAALAAAQERTARSQRVAALTGLAAGAAHELGTPIGSIALAAEALEESLSDHADADVVEDVRLIRAEVRRCRRILQELAESAGEVPGEGFAAVELTRLAEELRDRLGDGRAARLTLEIDPGEVRVPRGAVVLAVLNLLQNAFEASPATDRVRLGIARDGETLEIVVQDDGDGMDAETLARANEPFFSTKQGGANLGLGLFLAQGVAAHLDGELALESVPGAGTTAVLRLPTGRVA